MKFSVFQISRKGGREKNEDRMGYCYTRESGLFVLADGMGGHPEGEVAAQLALQTISALYQKEAKPLVGDVTEFLLGVADGGSSPDHPLCRREGHARHAAHHPGGGHRAGHLVPRWVHCGDSRLYLVRHSELLTRTRDHSYLEQQNATPARPATDRINRNILFTCLGSPTKPVFDITGPVTLQQGDKMLLCSDGLWSSLSDVDIVRDLGTKPVSDAVPDLVETALRDGGDHSDNVTVIALEWETPDCLRVDPRHFHRQHHGRRVRLHHPGRCARHHGRGPRRRGHRDARSPRSTRPSGVRPHAEANRHFAGRIACPQPYERIPDPAAAPPTSCARCASRAATPCMPKARC